MKGLFIIMIASVLFYTCMRPGVYLTGFDWLEGRWSDNDEAMTSIESWKMVSETVFV